MTVDPEALSYGRLGLQQKQRKWLAGAALTGDDPLKIALARAARREEGCRWDGDHVWTENFRYSATVEKQRLARTRAIIQRVYPKNAPEDGAYLEMLARQAATIEMYLANVDDKLTLDGGPFDAILIGTTGEPRSTAFTSRVGEGITCITVSAGLMMAYYQFAKAVVYSWRPVEASGDSLVEVITTEEAVEKRLNEDSTSVDIAYGALTAWLFDGVPRPHDSFLPPPSFHPQLAVMINYAERFVLAHEYVHALIDFGRLPMSGVAALEMPSSVDREFRADFIAALVVAGSALSLDNVSPNIALSQALLAMQVHTVLEQAQNVFGVFTRPSETHPPFAERAELVRLMYQDHYGGSDDPRLAIEGLEPGARALRQIWQRVHARLAHDAAQGAQLHPIWVRG